MPFYIYTDEMYHHGIKGQRWGIRRYQNKDGSLTPAGKKRYSDGEQKQTRYDKYYEKYKTLGYDDEKAAKAAKGRVAAERSLIVAGSVAVAATAAYAGYRYWDNTKDRMISPEQVMQTVHKGDAATRMQPGSPFYATYGKKDNTIYASKVFSHFTDESKITKFYTEDGIKVASEKTGRKILDDLIKTNPEVKAYMDKIGDSGDIKKKYHKFNWSLVLRNDSATTVGTKYAGLDHDKVHNIFYEELRKRGYGGIIDTNDSKREGFTFNPVIVFDKQAKHVISSTKATKEQLSSAQLAKGIAYAKQRRTLLNPTNDPVILASGVGFLTSIGITTSTGKELKARAEFVEQYKKDHPNTKLSNSEINQMYGHTLQL